MPPRRKRRKKTGDPLSSLLEEDAGYVPHVRLRDAGKDRAATVASAASAARAAGGGGAGGGGGGEGGARGGGRGGESGGGWGGGSAQEPLLVTVRRMRATGGLRDETDAERRAKEEAELLEQVKLMQRPALVSAKEHAEGVRSMEEIETTWEPPKWALEMDAHTAARLRKKLGIDVEGANIPTPLRSFAEMKLPHCLQQALRAMEIEKPTPVQMQGLPVALSGRDMVGVASTGSGKTLAFGIPLVLFAMQEELRMPLGPREGPIGIVIAPAKDLARQTAQVLQALADKMMEFRSPYPSSTTTSTSSSSSTYTSSTSSSSFPVPIRVVCCVGGQSIREDVEAFGRGVHVIAATPGRLLDHLKKRRISLSLCRYVVLDEGDRMLDTGFDEDIQGIFSFFRRRRQTVIYSATMPKRFEEFAGETLVNPVIVNVGRAGAANLNIIQEVEYVPLESRIVYLLEALQKTAPPVIIFARNVKDVEEIQEYLLLKGVAAACVHGSMDQDLRNEAIDSFRAGSKDVLVATDVAGKGLDFKGIRHVINFDLPSEIENYVHRIGRTGRGGLTGVATTFITKEDDVSTLLDLKHLLREAKQRIPPVIAAIEDPLDVQERDKHGKLVVCAFCQGLGHSILACPKLARVRRRLQAGKARDGIKGGD